MLVEYADCYALNFVNGAELRNTKEFDIDFDLVNGRKIELELYARQKKDGTYKVVEVLFDKTADEQDIIDLSGIYWYIIGRSQKNKKVRPILNIWEDGDYYIIASIDGRATDTVKHIQPRTVCWWPSKDAWQETAFCRHFLPISEVKANFYTYDQFAKRNNDIPYQNIGLEYARQIRNLRSQLQYCKKNHLAASLKVVDVDKAQKYIHDNRLEDNEQTWASLVTKDDLFIDMPDIYTETNIVYTTKETGKKITIEALSYYPAHPADIDCIAAVEYLDKVKRITKYWLNPLFNTESLYNKVFDMICAAADKAGITKIEVIQPGMSFESCPHCGELLI